MTDQTISPAILLHTPQLGENIGSAARVMLNFGLKDLRLIAPRDGWPNSAADTLAAGALESGVEVSVHADLEGALSGLTYLLATTARPRGMEKPVFNAADAVSTVQARIRAGYGQAGILFGGESSGLDNASVALSDGIVTYPVSQKFKSLNLSMAVGVFCHAWGAAKPMLQMMPPPEAQPKDGVDAPASRADLLRMYEHFEDELERAGYFFPPEKTPVMKQNLRAAFARGDWTTQEVRTFRGAVKALALGRGKARVERIDEAKNGP